HTVKLQKFRHFPALPKWLLPWCCIRCKNDGCKHFNRETLTYFSGEAWMPIDLLSVLSPPPLDARLAQASRAAGFCYAQPVQERYTIEKGFLVGNGPARKTYAPAAEISLAAELARVERKELSIEEFA